MQQHRQFREQMKQQHRQQLQHLGLGFCDDNASRIQKVEAAYRHIRGVWEWEAGGCRPIIAKGVDASTTDNDQQTIEHTVANDRHFWSSTGSATAVAHEALLYELEGPAARVAFIQMAVYRAFYQHGYPVYPPLQLQVWLGQSPLALSPASPILDVQSTDALQTFALYTDAPFAKYLQVRMFGKQQKQQEDMQFYTAIRHVAALGHVAAAPQLMYLKGLLRSGVLEWGFGAGSCWCSGVLELGPAGALLPGSGASTSTLNCMPAQGSGFRDAAPEAAAAAAATAANSAADPQQQQQQQQPGAVPWVEELVVRQQPRNSKQHLKPGRERNALQQQQQRSSRSAGFWSALSSNFSRMKNSSKLNVSGAVEGSQAAATAAAVAAAAAAEHAEKCEPLGCISSSSRSGVVVPTWLQPQQQQQQDQTQQQQQQLRRQPQVLPDLEADFESDDEYDSDAEEQHADQAMLDVASMMAQRDQFEFMLVQAIQRVDDPHQLEQVLAAWLQDDPLANAVPDSFRSQHAAQQSAGAGCSAAAAAAAQQIGHAWGLPAAPALMKVGVQPYKRDSHSSGSGAGDCAMDWQQQEQQQQHYAGIAAPVAGANAAAAAAATDSCAAYEVSYEANLQASLLLPLPGIAAAAAAGVTGRSATVDAAAAAAAARGPHGSSSRQASEAAAAAESQSCSVLSDVVVVPADHLFEVISSRWRYVQSCTQQVVASSWFEEGVEEDLLLQQQVVAV